MKIKQWVILLISVFCLGKAYAEDKKVTWSWETQFRSEYLGKIGIIFYDKPIMVNDVGMSYGDFFVGMWNSTGLGGNAYGSTFADEFDLYAGWGHTFDWIRVQALGSYFAIKDLDRLDDDIYVFEAETSFPKVPFMQPFVAVRSFLEVSNRSPEEGWFAWAGLRRVQPLGITAWNDEVKLHFEWMNGYSDGALGRTPGFVFTRFTGKTPISLSDHFTLTPQVLYQRPLGGQRHFERPHNTHDEVVGMLSLKYMF